MPPIRAEGAGGGSDDRLAARDDERGERPYQSPAPLPLAAGVRSGLVAMRAPSSAREVMPSFR